MADVGKRKSSDITFCANISLQYKDKLEKQNILKNRIYSFNSSDTWNDILYELLNETDSNIDKCDTVEISVSKSLNGGELFHPDCEEEIHILYEFNKNLKYVNFIITKEFCPESRTEIDNGACSSSKENAFEIMMSSTQKIEKQPRPKEGLRLTGL